MVNNVNLDNLFGALSDGTRRDMVVRLSRGPATVGELALPFRISKGAVTKHIKVLERAGLLRREIHGRVHRCEFDAAQLDVARRWVEGVRQHWENRFDDLAVYLDDLKNRKEPEA